MALILAIWILGLLSGAAARIIVAEIISFKQKTK
jgi:hypothetical protein